MPCPAAGTIPRMSSWRSFCIAVHLTCLGLWAGAVAMAAATAAVAFPKLHHLEVRITEPKLAPGFEQEHYRFAAGAVAQTVFLIGDMVSFVCAMGAALTLLAMVVWLKLPLKQGSTYVRALALGIALASLAALLFVITPQINAAAAMHLEAAKIGDVAAAALHRKAVDDLHPISSKLFGAEFLGALVALFVGAWSLGGSPSDESRATPAEYPEPELLRRKRA
jgi:hypothetical protein